MGNTIKALGKMVSNIFNPAAAAEVARPFVLPARNETTAKVAAQKKIGERRKRGREGTIYTDKSSYSGTNLGGTA